MAPRVKRQAQALKYQYRLLWHYVGSKNTHEFRGDRQATVLKMLRRVATPAPWLGMSRGQVKKGWARLCMRMNVPFEMVAGFSPKEMALRIQATFPLLDWVRVEHRQVGEWVETIDPLNTLRTPTSDRADARTTAMFAEIEAMSQAQLDAWRSRISADFLAARKTRSNNRELVTPEVK